MRILVQTPDRVSGRLQRAQGQYLFTFDPGATAADEPALGMPLRPQAYERSTLFPIFQMNLPEGFVLEQIKLRLAKTGVADPLLLLNVIGSQAPIGRLRYQLEDPLAPSQASQLDSSPGVSLAQVLTHHGSRTLFANLVDAYVLRSGLSGVQPKVLVPEALAHGNAKAALNTSDLIVKSGLDLYPGLSINEFFCMSVVQRAGIPVPEFFLSDDGELFVMRRFDRPADGRILGFEDMVTLAGREAEDKYTGSYKNILTLLSFYCSPAALPAARAQLFDMVALSCILGNGDAHLKNFGVLYDQVHGSVWMAPAYDIACTRFYLPDDTLALNLEGSKVIFAARHGLLRFGLDCGLPAKAIRTRLLELAQLTLNMLEEMADTVARLPGLREAIEPEALLYRRTFGAG